MNTIPVIDQCTLCDNLVLNFQTGAVCGLTDQKPNFDYQCSKFHFGEKAEELLVDASANVFLLNKQSPKKRIEGISYLILGCLVLLGAVIFTVILWEAGWMTTFSATIFAMGTSLLAFGIRIPIQHQKKKNRAKAKLEKLEAVAQFYKKHYSIEHEAVDVHGELEIRSRFNYSDKL